MILDLSHAIEAQSFLRLLFDQSIDKVYSLVTPSILILSIDLNLFLHHLLPDLVPIGTQIRSLNRLDGYLSCHEFKGYDSYCVKIYTVSVICSAYDFRCHVAGRAACVLEVSLGHVARYPEICDL